MTSAEKPARGELIKAIYARDAERAELLILQGADPNESDQYDQTCLMQAICEKLPKIVEMLVERGANVNAQNCHGSTPLMCDVFYKRGYFPLLIEHGASLEAEDEDGQTVLDLANKRYPEVVEQLTNAVKQRQQRAAEKTEEKLIAVFHDTAAKRQQRLKNLRPQPKPRTP